MAKQIKAKRGGPRPRERTAVLLRIDPELAAWYQERADDLLVSRTVLMERALAVVREMQNVHFGSGGPAVTSAGMWIIGRLNGAGLVSDHLRDELTAAMAVLFAAAGKEGAGDEREA